MIEGVRIISWSNMRLLVGSIISIVVIEGCGKRMDNADQSTGGHVLHDEVALVTEGRMKYFSQQPNDQNNLLVEFRVLLHDTTNCIKWDSTHDMMRLHQSEIVWENKKLDVNVRAKWLDNPSISDSKINLSLTTEISAPARTLSEYYFLMDSLLKRSFVIRLNGSDGCHLEFSKDDSYHNSLWFDNAQIAPHDSLAMNSNINPLPVGRDE